MLAKCCGWRYFENKQGLWFMVPFSHEVFGKIIERVAGGESISRICNDDGFPAKSAAFSWVYSDEERSAQYARAVQQRADARFERLEDYKDGALSGKIPPDVARILIDTEKWQAGKESPKYSDKPTNAVQVNIGGNAIASNGLPAVRALLDRFTVQPVTIDHDSQDSTPADETAKA